VQLVGWPLGPACGILQIEVHAAGDGGAGGPIGRAIASSSDASQRAMDKLGALAES